MLVLQFRKLSPHKCSDQNKENRLFSWIELVNYKKERVEFASFPGGTLEDWESGRSKAFQRQSP